MSDSRDYKSRSSGATGLVEGLLGESLPSSDSDDSDYSQSSQSSSQSSFQSSQ